MIAIIFFMLLIPAFSFAGSVDSDNLVLNSRMIDVDIRDHVSIYYDKEGRSNIHTILNSWSDFKPYGSVKAPGKFVRNQYTKWLSLRVVNPVEDTFFLCLNGSYPVDSIWLFKGERMI
ncbi:MAG: hypothetical protein J5I59_07210 [Saprospiraceae bacterium]|nr:hypothetical protein [Saprospiraceae bacterium]